MKESTSPSSCRSPFGRELIVIVLLTVAVFGKVSAAATRVCDATALNNAANNASPGAEIVMCSKTWSDVTIAVVANGTASAPIRLVAEEPGKVVFSGSSTVSIGGSYIEVDGIEFAGTYTGTASELFRFKAKGLACNHCRLTNSAVIADNPSSSSTRTECVLLYGQYNRVDHNYFVDKTNVGPTVSVEHDGTNRDYHRIDHNFFSRPFLGTNGGESVKVGQLDSLSASYTVIEDNYFYKADGEVETISLKASNNTVRHNTLDSSQGSISLRQGNGDLIEGNFIFGRGKDMTGGIRASGENHVIINNYISGINPSGGPARGGIVLMSGELTYSNSAHNAVKNVLIASNTIVDSGRSLVFGLGSSTEPVVPTGVTVANNVFDGYKGDLVDQEKPTPDITYVNNFAHGGSGLLNILNAVNLDPKLILDAVGVKRLSTDSPLINSARQSFNVTKDMDGQLRRSISDVGADQKDGTGPSTGPIGRCEVGPVSYDPSSLCDKTAPPKPPEGLTVS